MSNIDFTMTYWALKMFGKQLYANMTAAIAELVANGLDANAKNVYVYMDIRNKDHATIAVLDDGDGMNEKILKDEYAVIGRNKRKNISEEEAKKLMGRKGIGKLAALYLSNRYFIATKMSNDSNARAWVLDVSNISDDDNPQLVEQNYPFEKTHALQNLFESFSKGTLIYLNDVKIRTFGEAAENGLEHTLANYFLIDSLHNQSIKLCVIRTDNDELKFKSVKKNIAYDNMAVIYTSDICEFDLYNNTDVLFKDENIKTRDHIYKTKREILVFPEVIETRIKNAFDFNENVSCNRKGEIVIDGKSYSYEFNGWIGIHSSILKESAALNSQVFEKNIYYNPNQLRIYVRNKLATSNFLKYLGLTAAFLNYIEGEISFDILDVDGLEDITTAGRDDFSVKDERVTLLICLCKGIVNRLIGKRQLIADNIKKFRMQMDALHEQQEKNRIKSHFFKGQNKSKNVFEKLSDEDKNAISEDYTQFARAANISQPTKTIFISHKSDCKEFGNFIIDILLTLCPEIKSNIIFTSNSDYGVPQGQDICDYLNDCFRNDMHVVFLFSRSFYDSNICISEAGAAWGTNKKYTNFVIDLGFSDIDKPLNSSQKGVSLINQDLDNIKDFAKEIIRILNSVGVDKTFENDIVVDIIKNKYSEYSDRLQVPIYKPLRKFQAIPKCLNCNHPMTLNQSGSGNVQYTCECSNIIGATIK